MKLIIMSLLMTFAVCAYGAPTNGAAAQSCSAPSLKLFNCKIPMTLTCPNVQFKIKKQTARNYFKFPDDVCAVYKSKDGDENNPMPGFVDQSKCTATGKLKHFYFTTTPGPGPHSYNRIDKITDTKGKDSFTIDAPGFGPNNTLTGVLCTIRYN